MTVDEILASSLINEEERQKNEEFLKMTKDQQIAYVFNSILDIIAWHQKAINKIANLLENLNEQNREIRNQISALEDKIDSIEEVL